MKIVQLKNFFSMISTMQMIVMFTQTQPCTERDKHKYKKMLIKITSRWVTISFGVFFFLHLSVAFTFYNVNVLFSNKKS